MKKQLFHRDAMFAFKCMKRIHRRISATNSLPWEQYVDEQLDNQITWTLHFLQVQPVRSRSSIV